MKESDFQDILNVFLKATDQKRKTLSILLDKVLPLLKSRKVFCDFGFGDGFLTDQIGVRFDKTIALETNKVFCASYRTRTALNNVEIKHMSFDNYKFKEEADFILLSYVLGYLDKYSDREKNFEYRVEIMKSLVSNLSELGMIVIVNSTFESENYRALFQYMKIDVFDELARLENELKKSYLITDYLFPVSLHCKGIDELVSCFRLITYDVDRISEEKVEKYTDFAKRFEKNNGYLFTYESKISIIKDHYNESS